MSAEFVPLLSSLRARSASPSPSGSFTPVVPSNAPAAAAPPAHKHSEVKVELKRYGDFVRQIRIECKCGEVIELVCEY